MLLLIGLGAVLYLPGLWLRDLWNPDEPRYAEVARAMRVTGEYLVPHLNGAIYAEKPPLFFWMSAALQPLFGVVAGRVVVALLATGTMLLTYALGRLKFDRRTALLGACILGTSELFVLIGHSGVLDMPLTFFTLLAIYAFYRRGRWLPLFYVGMGLAVLTKGPVGIALVLLATVRRGWAKHPLWGIPLMLAVIAAWVVPACIRGGPEYTDTILFRQTAGRMVQSWSHQRPFWYYVPALIEGVLPWIFYLPRALARGWKENRRVFLWFVLGVVFFSLVSGKRERYLLPLYPALALMLASYVGRPGRRRGLGPHVALAVAGIALVVTAVFGAPLADRYLAGKPYVRDVFADLRWSPLLIAGGIAVWFIARRGRLRERDPWHVVAGVAVLVLAVDVGLLPAVNRSKSARPVAEALGRAAATARVGAYPRGFEGPYNLYSGLLRIETLETEADLEAFLKAPGRAVVLTSAGHLEHIEIDAKHYVREERRVGSRVMVFVTNYEPDGS